LDSFEFERHEISLCPGDRVVLFSDGVSEARSPSGELYGVERVARVLEGCRADTSGRELVNRLEQDVLAFTGGIYTDDTAILHFQYLSEPRLQSGA
jgi:serine phosphatase RsbU (regulator of sigma subunit)